MQKKQSRIARKNKRNHISCISSNNSHINHTSNDKYRSVIWRKRTYQTGRRSKRVAREWKKRRRKSIK